jgi:regulator of cell morphogenesis and NO signaling
MQFRTRLEGLARKVRARMPAPARGLLDRLESKVRPPTPPAPAPEPEPEPVAPTRPQKPVNWELRSQAELVDHIVQHYHAGLRRDLPRLIEAAHAGPPGLVDVIESLAADLESHMQKEERMLFPTLRTGARGGPIDMPIRMMEREHESHDEALDRIRELTGGFTPPADAANAVKQLYADLATLESDLRQHIYLENNVLFARALGGEY